MKKFLVALLFILFANSFVAPVFADSNVKKVVKLKVDSSTETNLKKAGIAFEKEYNDFCKSFKETDLCKAGFSKKYPKSSEIKTVKYNAERPEEFFNLVVAFYNELNTFTADRETETAKMNQQKQGSIDELLVNLAEKRSDLVKKLNKERTILNDLNLSDNYKDIDDATKENLTAPNKDLGNYAKKIDKKANPDDKIETHIEKDLSSNPDLSKKSDEDLEEWQKRLIEIDKSIDTEIAKTDKNITALENIKKKQEDDAKNKRQETLDDAWKALEEALKKEKEAFKNYDNKSVADYKKTEKEFDLTNMENAIKKAKNGGDKLPLEDHEPKISKPSLDAENFDELVENLKKQTTIANNNAEKLNNAKKKKDEADAEDKKRKVKEIKNLFDLLIKRNEIIENFEQIVYAKTNVNKDTKKKDMKYEPFGFNPVPGGGDYIKCGDNFGKSVCGTTYGKELKWNMVLNMSACIDNEKSEDCLKDFPDNTEPKDLITYIEAAILRAEENIEKFKEYVDEKQAECSDKTYWGTYYRQEKIDGIKGKNSTTTYVVNTSNAKTTDNNTLAYEIDECISGPIKKEIEVCRNKKDGYGYTTYDIDNYRFAERNYSDANDVKQRCYNDIFKKQCSKNDYKWPDIRDVKGNVVLTYEEMNNEVLECKEENEKDICEGKVKGWIKEIDDVSVTDDDILKGKTCSDNMNKDICNKYAESKGFDISIFNSPFDYGTGVKTCKGLVDSMENMFAGCPGLKGKDKKSFKNVDDIANACFAIESGECVGYLSGAQTNTEFMNRLLGKNLSSINTEVSKTRTLVMCKSDVEEKLCKIIAGGDIADSITEKKGTDTYNYLRKCKDELDRQIQRAVDKCNKNGRIIDGYLKTAKFGEKGYYESVEEVEQLCEKAKQSEPKRISIKDEASSFICLSNAASDSKIGSLIASINNYCKEFRTSPIQPKGSGSCYINNKRYVDKDPDEIKAGTKPQSMEEVLKSVLDDLVSKKCGRKYNDICKSSKAYEEGCVK